MSLLERDLVQGNILGQLDVLAERVRLLEEVIQTGDIIPARYGGIYAVDNATETTISSAGVAVQITIFDTNSPASLTIPDHTNDHITVETAGDYFVAVSATVNSVAGSASRFEMTVQKNNGAAALGGLHCDRNIAGGGGVSGVISMSDIVALVANDTIEVWIENETNTANYVVENIDLAIVQVG